MDPLGNNSHSGDAAGAADAQRQIRDSFLDMLPLLVNNLIPFLTLPIFTRILTKEDYGVLALAQVYAVFVGGLANFGMVISYERNYFQYRESRRDFAGLLFSSLNKKGPDPIGPAPINRLGLFPSLFKPLSPIAGQSD